MVSRSRIQARLGDHVSHLAQCRRCPRMQSTPVSGGVVVSDVMLIGQAPGPREPVLQRPFAHTARPKIPPAKRLTERAMRKIAVLPASAELVDRARWLRRN